jgi:flagellar protein FlaI
MTEEGCISLSSSITDRRKSTIILVEPKRSLIHIRETGDCDTNEPPWMSSDWDTVYIPDVQQLLPDLLQTREIYQVEPYLSFFYSSASSSMIKHKAIPLVRTPLEHALLEELKGSFRTGDQQSVIVRQSFMKRLESVEHRVFGEIAKTIPEISDKTKKRLSSIVSHQNTILSNLFPLLLDDRVEEVFLDRPLTSVYFDHQQLGRCSTDVHFTEQDVNRLVTLLRSESNLHLDRKNPSLKTHLVINDIMLRFSMTLPPLTPDGLHMEIRRARSEPFTILGLVENDSLSFDAAAFLILAVASRLNITITGAPGSGKTTLMNVLDATTPQSWRKLYIEDVIESRLLTDSHQVRIRVDPIDEVDMRSSKSSEIVKSLHRSPDYLILGEIQTQNHSEALFQALSAGIRTIQTCHSDSASGLVSRWIHNHSINPSSVAHMDVIVTMDRPVPGHSRRRVREIVEVRRKHEHGMTVFMGLNRIYDGFDSNQMVDGLVTDGAFNVRALELGVADSISSLDYNIQSIKDRIIESDQLEEPLGTILWNRGHPMKFGSTKN